MEIQIVHESVEGNFKNQAVVAFLFESAPGKSNAAISEWNMVNLPNPSVPIVEEFFQQDFNVWKFLYGESDLQSPPPFNYYKYMGSLTAPPCEENIVWFVHSKFLPLGSTAINMIKDALFATGKNAFDKGPNYDGSNRYGITIFGYFGVSIFDIINIYFFKL